MWTKTASTRQIRKLEHINIRTNNADGCTAVHLVEHPRLPHCEHGMDFAEGQARRIEAWVLV